MVTSLEDEFSLCNYSRTFVHSFENENFDLLAISKYLLQGRVDFCRKRKVLKVAQLELDQDHQVGRDKAGRRDGRRKIEVHALQRTNRGVGVKSSDENLELALCITKSFISQIVFDNLTCIFVIVS